MIGLKVVTKQREPEAAPPLKRTMTRSAIAAQLAKQRHDVPLKAWLFFRCTGEPAINGIESLLARHRVRSEQAQYRQEKSWLHGFLVSATSCFDLSFRPSWELLPVFVVGLLFLPRAFGRLLFFSRGLLLFGGFLL